MKNHDSNPLNTILLIALALIVADLFLNDGRVLAGIAANADGTTAVIDTAVQDQRPQNTTIQQVIVTATPGIGFTVIDDGKEPVIHDLIPTAQPTDTPSPTAAPAPTATAAPLLDDRGLPSMGPYSLDQVQQCEAIISNGHIDTLPSPQRELCQQYVNK